MANKIAQVVVGLPVDGPFDYIVPESLQSTIAVGQRVKVSFGRHVLAGFVVGLLEKSAFKKLKSVLAILDPVAALEESFLKFTKTFSKHYACSWGEAIEAGLPDLLRQPKVCEGLMKPLRSAVSDVHPGACTLIHDPDGERRWPVMFSEMNNRVKEGKGIIFLVPEVHLIEKTVRNLQHELKIPVVAFDKQLPPKEELSAWLKLKNTEASVVVGTRSAVFAPVKDLGLIVVFDEENGAYKQEQSPFYHARDAVLMRSQIEGADVILISSAPSAETWHAVKKNKIRLLSCDSGSSAAVQIIDMSNYHPGKSSLISVPLRGAVEKSLLAGKKVVLFMNRKGFTTRTSCEKCGYIMKCPRCETSLTYLYSEKNMSCRHCNYVTAVPEVCPQCRGAQLKSSGIGIEKLESEAARLFPQAKVTRYDKETEVLPSGFNILITTQAVFRMADQLKAGVVGVIDVDAQLNRADFRSAQKTFTLLVHLRQMASDKMFVQTRLPDNYCLKAIAKNDFNYFYSEELKVRKELALPPFRHLVAIGVRGIKEENVFVEAGAIYGRLCEKKPKDIDILEPHPDVLPKLRDKYRFTIFVKGKSVEKIVFFIRKSLKGLKKKSSVVITVNVDV